MLSFYSPAVYSATNVWNREILEIYNHRKICLNKLLRLTYSLYIFYFYSEVNLIWYPSLPHLSGQFIFAVGVIFITFIFYIFDGIYKAFIFFSLFLLDDRLKKSRMISDELKSSDAHSHLVKCLISHRSFLFFTSISDRLIQTNCLSNFLQNGMWLQMIIFQFLMMLYSFYVFWITLLT